MERQDVLRKITKLLALAGDNCNENEAANAAILARNLMKKYDIEERELDTHDESNTKVGETVCHKASYHPWEIDLASYMRYFLPVEILIKMDYKGRKRPAFIGHKADVDVVLHMYDYIRKTIWRLGRKQHNSRATRSFCVGASVTIHDRLYQNYLEEQRKARENEKSEDACYALICVDKQKEISNYLEETYPDMIHMKKKKTDVDMDAYYEGRLAGKRISLNQQIGS